MRKTDTFEFIAGFVVGTVTTIAGTIAVHKIVKEIKGDLGEHTFTSPDGNHFVTLSYGSSQTAKGLTYIQVKATTETGDDNCKLIVFAKKRARLFVGEWIDNEHFKLVVGRCKRKQCCDVNFEGSEITAQYYLKKDS